MQYRIQRNIEHIDWQVVCRVLQEAGLATHPIELTRKAFANSYCVVFVNDRTVENLNKI